MAPVRLSTKHLDIKLNDIKEQAKVIKFDLIEQFIKSGQYGSVNNEWVSQFENSWSHYHSNKYTVMCNNGTSAYITALKSLQRDKETTCVLLQNNSWASILFSTKELGYKYSFIDSNSSLQLDVSQLELWLSKNSDKYSSFVVVLTHILGYTGDYQSLVELKNKYNLYIIEDCSQAHGAIDSYNRIVGSKTSDAAFWSFYPTKPLGSVVEAGAVSFNSYPYYTKARSYINCGMKGKYAFVGEGFNLRPSPIAAIGLNQKLAYLDQWNLEKTLFADLYSKSIKNKSILIKHSSMQPVYHYFPILVRNRDYVCYMLDYYNIPYNINYPFTLSELDNTAGYPQSHKQSKEIISLPCHPSLTEEQVKYICKVINYSAQ